MPTYAICSSPDFITSAFTNQPPILFPRTAKIKIRPYLAPRIEYQYENEQKQIIYSNGGELSYTIEQIPKQCPGIRYDILLQTPIISNGTLQGWNNISKININSPYNTDAPYSNVRLLINGVNHEYYDEQNYLYHWSFDSKGLPPYGRTKNYRVVADTNSYQDVVLHIRNSFGIKIIGFEAEPNQAPCLDDCKFTVEEKFYDNDGYVYRTDIRHQEIRQENCPAVEQFECELGDLETVEANLKSLEILFISDSEDFDNSLVEFLDTSEIIDYLSGNPPNCLLVWKLRRQFGLSFSLVNIAQICSAAGCPPPKFIYECCICQSCPQNTCPVECGNHICCYDNQGIAVKSIPIKDYCNE